MTEYHIEGTVTLTPTTTPEPEPPPKISFDLRGLDDLDHYSGASCKELGFSWINCYMNPSNAVGVSDSAFNSALNHLSDGRKAFVWAGGWTKSTSGGTFKLSEGKLEAYLAYNDGTHGKAVDRPEHGHRYVLADDVQNDLTGYNNTQRQACLDGIRARTEFIKSVDPKAITCMVEYRASQVAMWEGVVDELLLDVYPTRSVSGSTLVGEFDGSLIPPVQDVAESNGIPYAAYLQAHSDADNPKGPMLAVPSPSQLEQNLDQWIDGSTDLLRGYLVFAWRYPKASNYSPIWLETDPNGLQPKLKELNTLYT